MFLYKHFVGGPNVSEIDDIGRNLRFIFSTKRGCGYFLESFGLTDIGFRTVAEMVATITREIEENVRLYEQRVELLGIEERYTQGRARLIVRLRVREGQEKLTLTVNLADRTFDISPGDAKRR